LWTAECERLRIYVNNSAKNHVETLAKIDEINVLRLKANEKRNAKVLEQRTMWTNYTDSNLTSIWSTTVNNCSDKRILKLLDEAKEKDPEFSLDETNELHQTALHVAAVNGQHALAKILLKQGAKTNLSDADMRTPLHEAAAAGWSALVKTLVEAGANIMTPDSYGDLPIHLAAEKNYYGICKTLINADTDASKISLAHKNSRGKRCIDLCKHDWLKAEFNKYEGMVQIVLDEREKRESELATLDVDSDYGGPEIDDSMLLSNDSSRLIDGDSSVFGSRLEEENSNTNMTTGSIVSRASSVSSRKSRTSSSIGRESAATAQKSDGLPGLVDKKKSSKIGFGAFGL
jgi:hypothetical protein